MNRHIVALLIAVSLMLPSCDFLRAAAPVASTVMGILETAIRAAYPNDAALYERAHRCDACAQDAAAHPTAATLAELAVEAMRLSEELAVVERRRAGTSSPGAHREQEP